MLRQVALPADRPRRGAPEFAALRTALREMAEALERARTREIEAERLRAFRETARRVAHEMRNPLTPIRLAVAQLGRSSSPAQREAIEVLVAESDRLEQLAREFTEFGRLPEGPAAPVDLAELLEELSRTSVPPTMRTRLMLDPATPVIEGHYDPLRRAFSNILRNAVEACGGLGEIEITACPEGTGARISIRDHGPGIPPELEDRIFDPYCTGKEGGTGLGLALAKQSVEHHGGSIAVEPTPGGGATFLIGLRTR
jgi:signal transduction histidine kinase